MTNEVKKESPRLLEQTVDKVFENLNGNFNVPSSLDVAELQKAQRESTLPQFGDRGSIGGEVATIYAQGYGNTPGFNALGRQYVEDEMRKRGLDLDESRMLTATKALAA